MIISFFHPSLTDPKTISFIASTPWWGGRDGNSIDSSLTVIACSAAAIKAFNSHPGRKMKLPQGHGSEVTGIISE